MVEFGRSRVPSEVACTVPVNCSQGGILKLGVWCLGEWPEQLKSGDSKTTKPATTKTTVKDPEGIYLPRDAEPHITAFLLFFTGPSQL